MKRINFYCESCETPFSVIADEDRLSETSYYCPFCGSEVEAEEDVE